MAVLKCKMCGGDINIEENSTVAECEYCGSKQTVPNLDDEKKLTLFARANRLRFGCEFDRAAGVYESIVADFPEEAEAYWGLILCKYGIEYVDDPSTAKKIPTCHRSSFDSVMDDNSFEMVMEYADAIAKRVYREEAKAIEELRKGIIEVSGKEEPYDIFICYKETDEYGSRTVDSVIAQDVYDTLTDKGYRVFFSRITLEDKLGQEYEPYIFAALNSAKIMLAFGTDYEYYNAVWVKNEWSRFIQLMAKDKSKYLIPCFKGIDAYDMPKEFAKLQSQDMGKVGAIQDLLRGIEKILPNAEKEIAPQPQYVIQSNGSTVDSLLKRAFMFLEDGDWKSADEYCEKVLDIDPENARAYLGKLCVKECFSSEDELFAKAEYCIMDIGEGQKAYRFADAGLKSKIEKHENKSKEQKEKRLEAERIERERQEEVKRIEKEKRLEAERIEREKQEKLKELQLAENCKRLSAIRKKIILAEKFVTASNDHTVGLKADGTVVAVGFNNKNQCNVSRLTDIVTISTGYWHTVGLKADGTVVAVGYNRLGQCKVSDWTDIVEISASSYQTFGLKADGTVVAAGHNDCGQCNVSHWTDIIAISTSHSYTVGLKADGTVVAVGDNEHGQCNVSDWTDIVAISTGGQITVGLKADGTVVAVGNNEDGQCNVSGWTDIVAISAECYHTIGLKKDGTIVVVGRNGYGQCNVSDWTDIVAISGGCDHTVGLKADGTVVAVGNNEDEQCNVSDWTDVVAISAELDYTVGLKADGTVVAVGYSNCGKCNVSDWRLFKNYEKLGDIISIRKKIKVLKDERSKLGLFDKKRKEINAQIAQLENEINKL